MWRFGLLLLTLLGSAGCSDREVVQSDWWLASAPTDATLEIVTYLGSSSCTSFDRVDVQEKDDEVAIRAFVSLQTTGDCTADDTFQPSPVTLSAPLGRGLLTGCVAPGSGNRAHDLTHDASVDCRTRVRPDDAGEEFSG